MSDNKKELEPGVYLDNKRNNYYIKYKGITRRGFSKDEANSIIKALKLGLTTIEDIDKKRHQDKCNQKDLEEKTEELEMFYAVAEAFLEKKHAEKTYGTYLKAETEYRLRIKPNIKNKRVSEMTVVDCDRFRSQISKAKLGSRQKNYSINLFKNMVRYGMKINHLTDDPTIYMEHFPKTYEEELKREEAFKNIWSIDEFKQFIPYVKDPLYRLFFSTIISMGLRLGEAQALKWNDYKDGYIRIEESVTEKTEGGGKSIKCPKNIPSYRTISVPSDLKKLLDEHKEKEKVGEYFDENWFIFGKTKMLSRSTINRKKNEAIMEAGVKYITTHQMRHTHGSYLHAAGVPIANIGKRLGHGDLNTTMKYYIHPTKEGNDILLAAVEKSSHELLTATEAK